MSVLRHSTKQFGFFAEFSYEIADSMKEWSAYTLSPTPAHLWHALLEDILELNPEKTRNILVPIVLFR